MKKGVCVTSRNTPTNRSNAQHLVEYEKQLLYEENQKSKILSELVFIPQT